MSDQQIRDAYGRVTDMIGGGWLNLKPGEVTDDTQMTLCVAAASWMPWKGITAWIWSLLWDSSLLHGLTASRRTLAAPAPIALPLQSSWAVFAGMAFPRLRTGRRPRDRPGRTVAAR